MSYMFNEMFVFGTFKLYSVIQFVFGNVELPDGSNMNMDRLPVSQKVCSPYIGVGSTNGE